MPWRATDGWDDGAPHPGDRFPKCDATHVTDHKVNLIAMMPEHDPVPQIASAQVQMHIPLSMALAHRELALLLINVSHHAAEPPKMLPAPLLHAGLRETLPPGQAAPTAAIPSCAAAGG